MNNEGNIMESVPDSGRGLKYYRREKILRVISKIVFISTAVFTIAAFVMSISLGVDLELPGNEFSGTGDSGVDKLSGLFEYVAVLFSGMFLLIVEWEILHILNCILSPNRTRREIFVNAVCAVLMLFTVVTRDITFLFLILWVIVRIVGGIACLLKPMD